MATNTKSKPKSKAVVGSKKSNQMSSRSSVLLGLVAIMIILAGVLGYKMWQDRQLNADAAGWTVIGQDGVSYVRACKSTVKSKSGPIWRVKVMVENNSTDDDQAFVEVRGYKPPTDSYTVVSTTSVLAKPGRKVTKSVDVAQQAIFYGGEWFPNYLNISISFTPNKGGAADYGVATLADC